MSQPHERIILALDVGTEREALELVALLKPYVGFFKVGLELLNAAGVEVVRRIADVGGRVFLDGKFMDIPATVAGASRAVTRLAIRMFNVHCMGGRAMMTAAAGAAAEEAARLAVERPLLLGVTVLTSLDEKTLRTELKVSLSVEEHVTHLAQLAVEAGLDGVIASPHELLALRTALPDQMLIVTPGVRPVWAAAHDQKRITTPSEAIRLGASYVVIGRPITQPPREIGSPVDAVRRIADEIASAASLGG